MKDVEPDLARFFAHVRQIVDSRLDELAPSDAIEPQKLHSAIRWSLLGGGKRLRPALVFAAGTTLGATEEYLLDTACAFEMLHTYSLIHDDLPSMDDDDLRRGRATCHVKFDEATAILAGDALQAMAFQAIVECETLSDKVRTDVIRELAVAAGTPAGMVAGQSLDLDAEDRTDITPDELHSIHSRKTGALIKAAARSGGLIAGGGLSELNTISKYASHLGLLFQITDDLLDVTATAEDIGKTPGKDAKAQKATYPLLYGIERTKELATGACEAALEALQDLDYDASLLAEIARSTLCRRG